MSEKRYFAIYFNCEKCVSLSQVMAEVAQNLQGKHIPSVLKMYKPFCCSTCGYDGFSIQSWVEITEFLNNETAPLKVEIASLQEAAAERDAIIEAQSEAIGTLKSFVRGNFPLEHPSDIRYANEAAHKLMAQWEAESESEAVE